MTPITEMKQLLYDELQLIVRTSTALLRRIRPEEWSYKPVPQMRTLGELAQHLALVPATDLLILKEEREGVIRELEGEYANVTDADKLAAVLEQGVTDLKAYMDALSEDDFLHKATRPFYLDHGSVQAKWLIEVVTHAQHHRAQLFTYLKQLGHEVSMFDLY